MAKVDNEEFIKVVKEIYIQNPCKVSSLAFWKLAQICRECETYLVNKEGKTYIYAVRDKCLEFYWSDDRQNFHLTPSEIEAFEFIVLHADFYRLIADQLTGYQVQEIYPLLYDFTFSLEIETSNEFYIADFDFTSEVDYIRAAEMLNHCYATEHHNANEVAGWCRFPVFDETLWFWVKNRVSYEAVGLGISTYQADIRECYLDWIQVLPEYQGHSLGRLLIHESIRRAIRKSDIIRVTGKVDDFYRKNGFTGTECWYLISK